MKVEAWDPGTCCTEVNGGPGGGGVMLDGLLLPPPQATTSVRSATTAAPRRASMCFCSPLFCKAQHEHEAAPYLPRYVTCRLARPGSGRSLRFPPPARTLRPE